MRIECVTYGVGIPLLCEIDVGNLSARVNARVGTAGALHQRFVARERFDRGSKQTLNGKLVGLDLPSGEWAPVVFNSQLVARHIRRSECRVSPACPAGIRPPTSAACPRA